MGYNLKNARNGKPVENIKMAKFEAPGIKEWRLRRFVQKVLLDSKTLLSKHHFLWISFKFSKN